MIDFAIIIMTIIGFLYFLNGVWKDKKDLIPKFKNIIHKKKKEKTGIQKIGVRSVICIADLILTIILSVLLFQQLDKTPIYLRIALTALSGIILFAVILCIVIFAYIVYRELRFSNSKVDNALFLYSFITLLLESIQIMSGRIESYKGMIIISLVLYVINMVCIGKIVMAVMMHKLSIKNIWIITLADICFVILSLSSMSYCIQYCLKGACYSRVITSLGDSIYFVMISFFTVGYGDLFPTAPLTKVLALVIVLTGFFFSAVCLSVALSVTMEKISERE